MSRGVVGKDMASPGVRSYHIARVLAEQIPEATVTLAAPNEPDIPSPNERMKIVQFRSQWDATRQMLQHDIIISRNFPPHVLPVFLKKRMVLDYFTCFFIEWMELSKRYPTMRSRKLWMRANDHYSNVQLTLADYLFCSNDRQRDVFIGSLSMLGLLPPATYNQDNTMRELVGVIPYGVQASKPEHKQRVLKGVVPGIGENDKVLIWNGLLVEWFDANTVVRAMGEVCKTRDDVKLFFLGTNHPDWVTSAGAPPVQSAIELSKQLGIYEKNVFFNFGWVPYEEIGSYLCEADIGVCAGYDNLESRYAFRTRYMDLFWAELPTVCTSGDVLAERIGSDPLGVSVPPGDHEAFARGVLRLVEDEAFYAQCKANLPAVKQELSWERTLAPLVDFCRSGHSIAVPKSRRTMPFVRRSAAYFIEKTLALFVR
jgi:glycosyltransferase involved in cell wall biosynthesis